MLRAHWNNVAVVGMIGDLQQVRFRSAIGQLGFNVLLVDPGDLGGEVAGSVNGGVFVEGVSPQTNPTRPGGDGLRFVDDRDGLPVKPEDGSDDAVSESMPRRVGR